MLLPSVLFDVRNELHLDEYIIMPNHLHAIVILDNTDGLHVETHDRLPKSISSFIAGFKSVVNSKIDDYIDENHLDIQKYNRDNHFFQSNYHDHVIRNCSELLRI